MKVASQVWCIWWNPEPSTCWNRTISLHLYKLIIALRSTYTHREGLPHQFHSIVQWKSRKMNASCSISKDWKAMKYLIWSPNSNHLSTLYFDAFSNTYSQKESLPFNCLSFILKYCYSPQQLSTCGYFQFLVQWKMLFFAFSIKWILLWFFNIPNSSDVDYFYSEDGLEIAYWNTLPESPV